MSYSKDLTESAAALIESYSMHRRFEPVLLARTNKPDCRRWLGIAVAGTEAFKKRWGWRWMM
jgi:hypothetical protein